MSAGDAAIRALLTVVFTIAVIGKLRHRFSFAEFVTTLVPLVNGRVNARVAALAVIAAEVLAAGTLITVPRLGYPVAAATYAVLGLGVWSALRRGLRVRCACFGDTGKILNAGHALRNVALAGLAIAGLAGHLTGVDGGLHPGIVCSAAIGGAVLGWCVTRWDDIAALFG